MKAVDNDVGPNAAVLYRLKQDPSGDYRSFAIDQVTGLITVRSPFDRERQKTYNVRVLFDPSFLLQWENDHVDDFRFV